MHYYQCITASFCWHGDCGETGISGVVAFLSFAPLPEDYDMPLRKSCLILLVAAMPAMAVAAVKSASLRVPGERASLVAREQQVWAAAVHDSEFSAIPRSTTRNSCA